MACQTRLLRRSLTSRRAVDGSGDRGDGNLGQGGNGANVGRLGGGLAVLLFEARTNPNAEKWKAMLGIANHETHVDFDGSQESVAKAGDEASPSSVRRFAAISRRRSRRLWPVGPVTTESPSAVNRDRH
jgi:hypothetical protein